jgi:hypothetical protein
VAVVGLEREALRVPLDQPAGHRRRVEARLGERVGRHRRAAAGPAVEDDGAAGVERVGLRGDLAQRDVARAGDVAGLPLVVLAHVDELHVALLEGVGHRAGLDVLGHGGHRSERPP